MRFVLFIAAAFLLVSPPGFAECSAVATIPLERLISGHFALPLRINGVERRFLVDTGASNSLVTARTAAELALPRTALANSAKALSGDAITEQAHLQSIELGGLDQDAGDFAILPNASPLMDGIIGIDLLGRYDVEFDFAQNRMTLYAPGRCRPDWITAAHSLTYATEQNHMAVPVTLDGKPFTAWLDTGAQQTLISRETAEANFTLDPSRTMTAKPPRQKYRFATLMVVGFEHANPLVVLAPDATLNFHSQARLLLGIDILHQHHLFVAFAAKTVAFGAAP